MDPILEHVLESHRKLLHAFELMAQKPSCSGSGSVSAAGPAAAAAAAAVSSPASPSQVEEVGKKRKNAKAPKADKPKKAKTPYNTFVATRAPHVHPEAGENMMKLISAEWNGMDAAARQTYVDQAATAATAAAAAAKA